MPNARERAWLAQVVAAAYPACAARPPSLAPVLFRLVVKNEAAALSGAGDLRPIETSIRPATALVRRIYLGWS